MYAIQYDDRNGEILNVVDAQFADSNEMNMHPCMAIGR